MHSHTVRKALLVAFVAVLVCAGPVFAPAVAPAANVAAAPSTVNYYESSCAYRARTSRGIPPLTLDQSRGLVAWERSHVGTVAAREYHLALDACAPVAKWAWGSMVLAHTELYGG